MSLLRIGAAFLGLFLGTGFVLILHGLPWMRRPTFSERIAPQLRAVSGESALLRMERGSTAVFPGVLERILRPALDLAVARLSVVDVGNASVVRRLGQLAPGKGIADFRAEQLLCSIAGSGVAVVAVVLTAFADRFNPLLAVAAVPAGAAAGFILRDGVLSSAVRRRQRRMLEEFPSVSDLIALSVGAGETASGAIERVSAIAGGELASEFRLVIAETRAGSPLTKALRSMSFRADLPAIESFVEGLVVAIERGTPLAEVLRAQAQDVRDEARRALMESAGKKEIGMMIPLVFGILPLTILFAVYPGIAVLDLGF